MPQKPPPIPRHDTYFGTRIINVDYPNGTWLEGEEYAYPNDTYTRRAWATCGDGQRRLCRCKCGDTNIPARATINGQRVSGFLATDEQGLRFHQDHQG